MINLGVGDARMHIQRLDQWCEALGQLQYTQVDFLQTHVCS